MSTPTTALARELVSTACSAPSVHNTQPWSWRIVEPDCIELYADRSRQLAATDPTGRDLTLSCGAALHHLVVAAKAFGLKATPELLPDRADADLFARVKLSPATVSEADVEMLTALENRSTDRRGFSDWEVPEPRLHHLAEVVDLPGVHVVVLTDRHAVVRTERLLEQARRALMADPGLSGEQDEWTGHLAGDGVPPALAQPTLRTGVRPRPDRFSRVATAPPLEDRPDPMLVVATVKDTPHDWLLAGEALSRLWMRAAQQGLGMAPQSHVVEVGSTRDALRDDVLEGMLHPQIVLRVGWPATSGPPLRRTPRRDLADVLRP